MCGYTQDPAAGCDGVLYKLDKNGNVLAGWPKQWDSGVGRDDQYYSVSQDINGDYCLVGSSTDASGRHHLLVTRYDRDGNQLTSSGWPQIVPLNGDFEDYPPPDAWHGSVDTSGSIAASFTSPSLKEIQTVKYTAGAAKSKGYPRKINLGDSIGETRYTAVDDLDNVYCVGYAYAGMDYKTCVVKYPPATYSTARPSLATNQGVQYTKLTGFTETLGAGNKGSVLYQLSPDGTGWYYHDGTRWMQAVTKYQANTAAEVNSHCDTFAQQAGTGSLHVKAFLVGDGSQKVQLHSVSVSYAGQ